MEVVVYWRYHQSDCLGSSLRMARAGKGNWAVAREYCETSSSHYCFERLWRGVVLVDGGPSSWLHATHVCCQAISR